MADGDKQNERNESKDDWGKIVVTICMGSSCFARGNSTVLQALQAYVANHNLAERVKLVGSRCEGQCGKGPNVRVNDELYHDVDAGAAVDLVKEYLKRLDGSGSESWTV
jgi:NADH:ubiquinone oxidoreductase subunit E